jgi:hypothetical protein
VAAGQIPGRRRVNYFQFIRHWIFRACPLVASQRSGVGYWIFRVAAPAA